MIKQLKNANTNQDVFPELEDGQVSTSKISDGAVTQDKLSSDAVSTDKIVDGAVTNDKITDRTISNSKLETPYALYKYEFDLHYSRNTENKRYCCRIWT